MNVDPLGVLCQRLEDGKLECGDGACWTGHWVYLSGERSYPFAGIFERGIGGYVRHPVEHLTENGFGSYYKNPWRGCISRDQMTGILAGIIGTKDRYAALRLIFHHALSLFLFSYNTVHNGHRFKPDTWKLPDFTGPDVWSLEIRSLGWFAVIFYPLLCVLDLQLLFSAIYNRVNEKDDPIKAIISREHMPTPTSWLMFKIINKDKLSGEIYDYWNGWRQQEGMWELYLDKIHDIS